MAHANPPDAELKQLLTDATTIAMVGASSNPDKTSHGIMQKLQSVGYRVIPVNPRETEILGQKCYPSLSDVPEPVDIVNVFRAPDALPAISRETLRIGADALWCQFGVINEEGAKIAEEGGVTVIMDRCLKVEHVRSWAGEHSGERGLRRG